MSDKLEISPKVAELSEKISNYMAKVDTETNRLQQLDNESQNLQQRIKSQQDVLGGMGLTQIEIQTSSYAKTLENRLQTVEYLYVVSKPIFTMRCAGIV